MTKSCKKLVITCGGTGGHFFPGLSIARELLAQGGDPLVIISGKNAASQVKHVRDAGLECVEVEAAPVIAKNPITVIRAWIKQYKGYKTALKLLKEKQPEAVLAMGSFTSFPTVWAAQKLKIPIYLHDGNARIGRANRFFSRWAKLLMTAFPAVNADACKCKVIDVGMPIRPEFKDQCEVNTTEAFEKIKSIYPEAPLHKNVTTLVVFGGSLGANTLNTILPKALNEYTQKKVQVIHLFGPKHMAENSPYATHIPSLCLESSPHMGEILAMADVVVSRAGGSTLAELSFMGRPALLIPFPFASEDHQSDNARYFVRNNAAILLPDHETNVENLLPILKTLLNDPHHTAEYAHAMTQLAKPNATETILQLIAEQNK